MQTILFGIIILVIDIVLAFFITIYVLSQGGASKKVNKYHISKILDAMDIKEDEIIYDLGVNNGNFILEAAKKFKSKFIGIELSPIMVLWARQRNRFRFNQKGSVNIIAGSFYYEDYKHADKIFINLKSEQLHSAIYSIQKTASSDTEVFIYDNELDAIEREKEIKVSDENDDKDYFLYKYKLEQFNSEEN